MTKELRVAEWFASKVAKENGNHFYTNTIFGILGETEKAMKIACMCDGAVALVMWAPKSLIKVEEYNDACDEVRDRSNPERYTSFGDCKVAFNNYMKSFR